MPCKIQSPALALQAFPYTFIAVDTYFTPTERMTDTDIEAMYAQLHYILLFCNTSLSP